MPILVFNGDPIEEVGCLLLIPSVNYRCSKQRCKRQLSVKQRHRDNTVGLHSQNVAGSPKRSDRCKEWFRHFRQHEDRGQIDLILLQEKRVALGEAIYLDNLYHQPWGFVTKPGRTLLTESTEARGGVATLLNPYSTITGMDPWNQHLCSRHWMAVRATHMDSIILVINVYAPTDKGEREGQFDFLRRTLVSYEGPVV